MENMDGLSFFNMLGRVLDGFSTLAEGFNI